MSSSECMTGVGGAAFLVVASVVVVVVDVVVVDRPEVKIVCEFLTSFSSSGSSSLGSGVETTAGGSLVDVICIFSVPEGMFLDPVDGSRTIGVQAERGPLVLDTIRVD